MQIPHDSDHDPLDFFDISNWNPNEHMQPMATDNGDNSAASSSFFSHGSVPFMPGMSPSDMNTDDNSVAKGGPGATGGGSTVISMRKNVIPTITTIYEPKFYEIYRAYQQYCDLHYPEIRNSNPSQQHLMTLCLNNLLPFAIWSREPASNAQWIRTTLFENPDMRPEVRNGLALILVYTFSSAKAADIIENSSGTSTNADMFSVLMKNDSGLGIVNKTSLKIYSDPYGYFNFLKTCISGLIDAQAIPENERLNSQITKKSRRGSRNRDEVEAFEYVKSSLTAMFQSPDMLGMARERINQILQFWQAKGKSIRTERFSAVFQLPPPSSVPAVDTKFTLDTLSMGYGNPRSGSGGQSNRPSNRSIASSDLPGGGRGWANPASQDAGNDSDKESVTDTMSSCSRSPHPSLYDAYGRKLLAAKYPSSSSYVGSPPATGGGYRDDAGGEDSLPAIPAMRFDRIGVHRWMATQSILYDLDALQLSMTPSIFYLVDEERLKLILRDSSHGLCEENSAGMASPGAAGGGGWSSILSLTLSAQHLAQGLTSIDKLLVRSNAVLTTWSPSDFPQLRNFIDNWRTKVVALKKKARWNNHNNANNAATAAAAAGQMSTASGLAGSSEATGMITAPRLPSEGSVIISAPRMPSDGSFNIGSVSISGTTSSATKSARASPQPDPSNTIDVRRTVRRRTTGAVDVKRDMARLQQLYEINATMDFPLAVPVSSSALSGHAPQQATAGGGGAGGVGGAGMSSSSISFSSTATTAAYQAALQPQFQFQPQLQLQMQTQPPPPPPPSMIMQASSASTSSQPSMSSPTVAGGGGGGGGAAAYSPHNPSNRLNALSTTTSKFTDEDDDVLSMIAFWHSLRGQTLSTKSRGMLVYERSMEVGLIIRANPSLGLPEDIWCMYYPEDAAQYFASQPTSAFGRQDFQSSFAAFLFQLLPQTRVLMKYLSMESSQTMAWNPLDADKPIITIGYYGHSADTSTPGPFALPTQSGPPAAVAPSQYRTIGVLNQSFHQLTSRFVNESFFHDIVLK